MAIVAILLFEGRETRAIIGGRIVLARWEIFFLAEANSLNLQERNSS